MPSNYAFITFSDLDRMRSKSAKAVIRKHAMRAIGITRRKPRIWTTEFAVRSPDELVSSTTFATGQVTQGLVTESAPSENIASDTDLPGPSEQGPPLCSQRDHLPHPVKTPSPGASPTIRPCKVDVFGTASIPITKTVHNLLRYFIYYSSEFPNNFTFSPCASKVVSEAMQDGLLMHCILSAAASRVQYIQGIPQPEFKKQEMVSTQQSLSLLQDPIQKARSQSVESIEQLIACVLFLGAAAVYRQDPATATIHVAAAVKLTDSIGGVAHLQDTQTLVRLISLDDVLSCAGMRPCTVDCSYDPGPLGSHGFQQDASEFEDDQLLPSGFRVRDGLVCPAVLRRAIRELIQCDRTKSALEASVGVLSPSTLKTRHWVTTRMLAIRNRLLSANVRGDRASALRLVLILWTLLPPCDPRQLRVAQTVVLRLKFLLSSMSILAWEEREEIHLLCLIVGFCSAQELKDSKTWFAEEIRKQKQLSKGSFRKGDGLREYFTAFQKCFGIESRAVCRGLEELNGYVRFWDNFSEQ